MQTISTYHFVVVVVVIVVVAMSCFLFIYLFFFFFFFWGGGGEVCLRFVTVPDTAFFFFFFFFFKLRPTTISTSYQLVSKRKSQLTYVLIQDILQGFGETRYGYFTRGKYHFLLGFLMWHVNREVDHVRVAHTARVLTATVYTSAEIFDLRLNRWKTLSLFG